MNRLVEMMHVIWLLGRAQAIIKGQGTKQGMGKGPQQGTMQVMDEQKDQHSCLHANWQLKDGIMANMLSGPSASSRPSRNASWSSTAFPQRLQGLLCDMG